MNSRSFFRCDGFPHQVKSYTSQVTSYVNVPIEIFQIEVENFLVDGA